MAKIETSGCCCCSMAATHARNDAIRSSTLRWAPVADVTPTMIITTCSVAGGGGTYDADVLAVASALTPATGAV